MAVDHARCGFRESGPLLLGSNRSTWLAKLSLFVSCFAITLESSLALGQALTWNFAQMQRVPPGKVMIPVGLVDHECVHEIQSGATHHRNGDVELGGAIILHHDPCTPEQLRRRSNESAQRNSTAPPYINHCWIDSCARGGVSRPRRI